MSNSNELIQTNTTLEEKVEIPTIIVKYPLYQNWTLWYGPWDNIQPVIELSSVEEFWCCFNNIISPTTLTFKKDLHFFKTGITPIYEDPANINGGLIQIDLKNDYYDKAWMNTLLSLIGCQYNTYNYITGVVGSSKASGKSRITMWVTINDDKQTLQKIASEWKKIIGKENFNIGFFPHNPTVKVWEPKYTL